jgi:signal transduction histidine kinase
MLRYSATKKAEYLFSEQNWGYYVAATYHDDAPSEPYRLQTLPGGEWLYIGARLLTIVLLFIVSNLAGQSLFPPFQLDNLNNVIFWIYVGIAVLLSALTVLRANDLLRISASIIDLLILLWSSYQTNGFSDVFYPLYFVPLISASIQLSRGAGIGLGGIIAGGYLLTGVPELLANNRTNGDSFLLLAITLVLRAVGFLLIPWVVNELMSRTIIRTQQVVVQANRESEKAIQEARVYREQVRSLYEVAYTLSTTMNYQTVLDVALSESRRLVSYSVAMALLSTGQEDELYVAAARGLSTQDQKVRLHVGQGSIGRALRSGEPALIGDVSREPELQGVEALRSCRAGCVVPLRAALRTYGVLIIATQPPNSFTQDHLGMVTALANYAIVALHNAQLIHDLREERTKLISKEEEVRHQLARDLHDGPAQALAAITMNIEFLKRLLDRDPSRVVTELDKMGQLAKRTTYEVRTMLFELRPLALETQGLGVTLKQYFERFQSDKTKIVLEADNLTAELDTKSEGTLFNIIQESVNNALKHAQAQHIWVRVKQRGNTLETNIQDDGRGFDLAKVRASYEQRGSFGLLNIEERAKLIGGFAELYSAPGQGTTVRIIIPLPE